jgi:hypothetical protein
MVNMNMIVNTSDLVGYEAEKLEEIKLETSKPRSLQNVLKAWEGKQARAGKKAAGFGLLAVSLAACNSDDSGFTQADIDAAKAEGVASVDTTSDDAAAVAAALSPHASLAAAVSSNDATVTATATAAALTHSDGTVFATVDAAKTAGLTSSAASEVAAAETAATAAALTSTDGTVHASIDAAILSNDAAITAAAETTLMSGSGFATVSSLLAAYNTEIAAVAASSATLTTSASDVIQGTTVSDSWTATDATLQTGDLVLDATNTDSDTLTVALTAASTQQPTISGVENVIYNVTSFAAADIDVDNIRGGVITVNQLQAGGSGVATVDDVAAGTTVTAGSGITGTLTVNSAAGGVTVNGGSATRVDLTTANVGTTGGTSTVNLGSAAARSDVDGIDSEGTTIVSTRAGTTGAQTAINLDGSTAATDSVTISAVGFVDLEGEVTAGDDIEIYSVSGNGGAVTYTFTGDETVESVTMTGDQDVTLVMFPVQVTGEVFVDSTTAGTTTLSLVNTAGVVDFDNVTTASAIDVINLGVNMAGNQMDLASGQTVNVAVTEGTGLDVNMATATAASNVLNLTISDNLAAFNGLNLGTVDVTNVKTVNITVTDPLTSTAGSFGATAVVNLSGAASTGTAAFNSTAGSLNASGLTGVLTTTLSANLKTVTGGAGDDAFTGYAGAMTLDGGAGSDTLNFATTADLSGAAVVLSNIEILQMDSDNNSTDTLTMKSSALSGKSLVVLGGTTADDLLIVTSDATTIDLGGLTVDTSSVASTNFTITSIASLPSTLTGTTGVDLITGEGTGAVTARLGAGDDTPDVSGGSAAHQVYGEAGADTITGGAGAETLDGGAGADIIRSGAGANTLTGGEGADKIVQGADADTIVLTETTAAADTVTYSAQGDGSAATTTGGTISGHDTVTGFDPTLDSFRFDSNTTDANPDADIDVFAGTAINAVQVVDHAAATNSSYDLADADFADADKLVTFMNDAGAAVAANAAAGQNDVVAIVFDTFTGIYVVDNASGAAIVAGEIEMLAKVDGAVLTAADLVIA